MTDLNRRQIHKILAKTIFSDSSSVESRASDIKSNSGNIGFSLDITGLEYSEAEFVRKSLIKDLEKIKDIGNINIVLTSSRASKSNAKKEKTKLHIDNVDKVILVASGKGGVGKSTISALIAHKLSLDGKKVGIIDADIYGPSIPHIFGLKGRPKLDNNRMLPLENHGISINSIGFLTPTDSSVSWRGPMVSKALYQLLSLTKWDDLDYLIVDTPPGTGDIHLSLLQNYIIDKVIMVTTPQKISEIDVNRAINLYQKFDVPILGIVENMSYYLDPVTSKKIKIFQGEGGKAIAKKHGIKLIQQIPINTQLASDCDNGQDLKIYSDLVEDVI